MEHHRLHGRISEGSSADQAFIRLDMRLPNVVGWLRTSRQISLSATFKFLPTTGKGACTFRRRASKPVSRWDLPILLRPGHSLTRELGSRTK